MTRITVLKYLFCFFFLYAAFLLLPADGCRAESAGGPFGEVSLQLRWRHQFQFAGYYAAVEKGFYRREGMTVTIREGGYDKSTVEEVLSGNADFGVTNSEILIARVKHQKPVVVIAAVFQHSPLVLLARESAGISTPQDLAGKRVKMTRKTRDVELHAMLANEGVPLDRIGIVDGPVRRTDYFDESIDAASAYLTNEPYYFISKSMPYTIINPVKYGIDFYGDCLFTTAEKVEENPALVKAFRRASLEGWRYAMSHEVEMIDLILRKYNPAKSRDHLAYEAAALEELIMPELVEIGHMNPGRWDHIAATFADHGAIAPSYSLDGFLYNPDAPEQNTWIWWVAGALCVVAAVASIAVLFLYHFYRRLHREVAERKRTEERLRANEEKYRRLFDEIPVEIIVVDAHGRVTDFNRTKRDAGTRLPNRGDRMYLDYAAGHRIDMRKELMDCIRENQTRYFRDMQYREKWLDITVSGFDGGALIVSENVTKAKAAERALQESEARYRNMIENTGTGICIIEEDHTLVFVNREYERITGYTKEEVEGKVRWSAHIVKEDLDEMVARHRKRRENEASVPAQYEFRMYAKTGEIKHILVNVKLIPGNRRSLASLNDITSLKTAEKEKEKAQEYAAEQEKNALVGQVAGKMAHDFNNILGAVMGRAELTMLTCGEEKTKTALKQILEQVERGRNITRNLVAFAKDQELKQESFNINEKIDLVTTLMKRELDGIEVVRDYERRLPDLIADPGMIEHALINLLQNAVHAVSRTYNPAIILKTRLAGDHITIEVEDNGCGIPEAFQSKIYIPSFTLKGSRDSNGAYKEGIKGTGYGMANVKKYVEKHKGRIVFESVEGRGTRFVISLPVIRKKLSEQEVEEREKMNNFARGKRILLVEDENAISDVQYAILTGKPFCHTVDVANSGQQAIRLLEENTYDVVSLDYVLPGEMSGMDVYRAVREKDESVPLLFISGNIEFLESIKELKQKDALIDHLSKPCSNADYVGSLSRLLETAA